jgi:hypothetical protein
MLTLTIIQLVWAALLVTAAAFQFAIGRPTIGAVGVALVAGYVGAIYALYHRRRWAWWLCLLPPITALTLFAPGVAYNLLEFALGDPIFADSPGTLTIVLVYAVLFVFPPAAALVTLLLMRKKVMSSNG